MHAIELLLDDHESVAGLFDEVRASDDSYPFFEKIKAVLESHKHVEETLFYPRLMDKGNDELKTVVSTAIEENRQVNDYLNELEQMTGERERFAPRLKVMMEDVEQHVVTEEEKLFPLVEEQFDEAELEKLGDEMKAAKARFDTIHAGNV